MNDLRRARTMVRGKSNACCKNYTTCRRAYECEECLLCKYCAKRRDKGALFDSASQCAECESRKRREKACTSQMKRTAERGARRSRNKEPAYTEYDEDDYDYEDDDNEKDEEEEEWGEHRDEEGETSLDSDDDVASDGYHFEPVAAAGSSETFSNAALLKFLEDAWPSAARALRTMQSSVRPYACDFSKRAKNCFHSIVHTIAEIIAPGMAESLIQATFNSDANLREYLKEQAFSEKLNEVSRRYVRAFLVGAPVEARGDIEDYGFDRNVLAQARRDWERIKSGLDLERVCPRHPEVSDGKVRELIDRP